MATTDYDFNLTRTQIIDRAFRIIGVLDPDNSEVLTGAQYDQGQIALNSLVKSWQTRSIFLWTLVKQTQALTASTASYTLGNDVMGIDAAYYTQGTQDIPVEVISYREYESLRQKQSTGNPTTVALGPEITTPTMYIWPILPAGHAGLTLTYISVIRLQDMDTASGNADIPQRFINALVYGLADDLADEYGVPLGERQRISSKYEAYFAFAKQSDQEWQEYEFVHSAFMARHKLG